MTQPVQPWSNIRDAVAKVMASRGVTVGRLQQWTGLGRSTLQGAIYGNTDTQWNTAAKILTALGLDLEWVHGLNTAKKGKSNAARRAGPKG